MNNKFIVACLAFLLPIFASAQTLVYSLALDANNPTAVTVEAIPEFSDKSACFMGGNVVLITPAETELTDANITSTLGSWTIQTKNTINGQQFFQIHAENGESISFNKGAAVSLFTLDISAIGKGTVRLMSQTAHLASAKSGTDFDLYQAGVQHTAAVSLNCRTTNGIAFNGVTSSTTPTFATPTLAKTSVVEVFPNPATDVLNVNINAATAQQTRMQLFNAAGQLTHDRALTLTEGYNTVTIKIADLPTGLYRLVIAGQEVQTTKAIVIVE